MFTNLNWFHYLTIVSRHFEHFQECFERFQRKYETIDDLSYNPYNPYAILNHSTWEELKKIQQLRYPKFKTSMPIYMYLTFHVKAIFVLVPIYLFVSI